MSDLSRIEAWQDEPCPHDEQRKFCCAECLLDLVASERAAATAACADLVQERKHRAQGARILAEQDDCFDFVVEKIVAEIRQWQSVEDEIRALSPEGWVGVRREDAELAVSGLLLMSAKWEFCEEEPLPIAAKAAEDAADRIRAALDAAKEG